MKKGKDVEWDDLKIYKTFDYEKFKFLKGNRKIRMTQVHMLKISYEKGQIPVPIVVNQSYEIIDGQHRIEALRQLGLPVPYTIMRDLGIRDVQRLNTQQKNWTIDDHLECYIERGNQMYIKYNERIHKRFEFTHSIKLRLLKVGTTNMLVAMFKNGEFEATNEEFECAIEIGKKIEDVEGFFRKYLMFDQKKALWLAVRRIASHSEYDHGKMIKKLEQLEGKIEKMVGRFRQFRINEFLIILEDVYNYHSSKNLVPFRRDLKSRSGRYKIYIDE